MGLAYTFPRPGSGTVKVAGVATMVAAAAWLFSADSGALALQKTSEALNSFMERSPGERGNTDLIKGKVKAKGLSDGPADPAAEQRALGKVFDSITPPAGIGGTPPIPGVPLAEEPAAIGVPGPAVRSIPASAPRGGSAPILFAPIGNSGGSSSGGSSSGGDTSSGGTTSGGTGTTSTSSGDVSSSSTSSGDTTTTSSSSGDVTSTSTSSGGTTTSSSGDVTSTSTSSGDTTTSSSSGDVTSSSTSTGDITSSSTSTGDITSSSTSTGDITSSTTSGVVTSTTSSGGTPPPVPAVPEPSTWAMMLLGFGFLGGAMRRRKAVAARPA